MPTNNEGQSDIVIQKTNTWNKVYVMPKDFSLHSFIFPGLLWSKIPSPKLVSCRMFFIKIISGFIIQISVVATILYLSILFISENSLSDAWLNFRLNELDILQLNLRLFSWVRRGPSDQSRCTPSGPCWSRKISPPLERKIRELPEYWMRR
jgi:hypothetical protein